MKKYLAIFIVLLLCLGGCTKDVPMETEQQEHMAETVTVATSFYPIYLMTLSITDGAEGVEVMNMAQPQTGCLHDYDLKTEDMKLLKQADVFFMNGLGMEHFLDQAREQNPDLYIVETGENATILLESDYEHEDHEDHEDEDAYNSHVWLHPANAAKQAEAIRDTMMQLDPKQAEIYRANGEKFIAKMKELEEAGKKLHEKREIPVAVFHEGFAYIEEWCGLEEEVGIFPEENQTPSAGEMADAMDEVQTEGIRYFLTAADGGESYAQMMAKETGGTVIELNPLTNGEGNKDEFIQGMEENLAAVSRIFNGE